MRIPSPVLSSGIYGLALAVLVISHKWTYALIELFVRPGYVLGTHEGDWTSWHAVGCGFVGLINLLCWRAKDWNASATYSLSLCTALIYTIWGLQNLGLMLATPPRFLPLMWLHVLLCLLVGLWNLAYWRTLTR
jgi:hypothetical protein